MTRVGYARNMARKLIRQLDITAPPVPVEDVADFVGLKVIPYGFPKEVSGVLVVSDDVMAIGVNKAHVPVRQRFSIAHEIGHFMLSHDDFFFLDFTDSTLENLNREETNKDAEVEANEFAAELLMPTEMVKRDFRPGETNPKEMAAAYGVSEQALWIKLGSARLV